MARLFFIVVGITFLAQLGHEGPDNALREVHIQAAQHATATNMDGCSPRTHVNCFHTAVVSPQIVDVPHIEPFRLTTSVDELPPEDIPPHINTPPPTAA